jgi:hypothetical protein
MTAKTACNSMGLTVESTPGALRALGCALALGISLVVALHISISCSETRTCHLDDRGLAVPGSGAGEQAEATLRSVVGAPRPLAQTTRLVLERELRADGVERR